MQHSHHSGRYVPPIAEPAPDPGYHVSETSSEIANLVSGKTGSPVQDFRGCGRWWLADLCFSVPGLFHASAHEPIGPRKWTWKFEGLSRCLRIIFVFCKRYSSGWGFFRACHRFIYTYPETRVKGWSPDSRLQLPPPSTLKSPRTQTLMYLDSPAQCKVQLTDSLHSLFHPHPQ